LGIDDQKGLPEHTREELVSGTHGNGEIVEQSGKYPVNAHESQKNCDYG
jgi:hypothetical protein